MEKHHGGYQLAIPHQASYGRADFSHRLPPIALLHAHFHSQGIEQLNNVSRHRLASFQVDASKVVQRQAVFSHVNMFADLLSIDAGKYSRRIVKFLKPSLDPVSVLVRQSHHGSLKRATREFANGVSNGTENLCNTRRLIH